nr:hypothetical protein [Oxalobacteraceae bacterium]
MRERDGKLQENWYIACLSAELRADRPIQRILYDQPWVLFRDGKGKAGCLPDRCLHRAVPLSAGSCHEGRISCPYHGWKYAIDGSVVEVPSEGPGCRPAQMKHHALRLALYRADPKAALPTRWP